MALYKAKGSRGLTGGHWVTIKDGRWKGQHVYIKDNQTFDEAIEERKKHARGLDNMENRPVANKLAKQKQNKNAAKEYYSKLNEKEIKEDLEERKNRLNNNYYNEKDKEMYEEFYNEGKKYYDEKYSNNEPSYKVKQGNPLEEMANDRVKEKQEALKNRQQLVEIMKAQNVDKFGEDTIEDLEFKNWRDQNYIYTANNDFENLKKNRMSQEERDKYMKENGLTLFSEYDEYKYLKSKKDNEELKLNDRQIEAGNRLNANAENGVRSDIKTFLSGKEDFDGSQEDFINELSNEWGVDKERVKDILHEENSKHPRLFKGDIPEKDNKIIPGTMFHEKNYDEVIDLTNKEEKDELAEISGGWISTLKTNIPKSKQDRLQIGKEIYYKGDQANIEGTFIIDKIEPEKEQYMTSITLKEKNGDRTFKIGAQQIEDSYGKEIGSRFSFKEDYDTYRNQVFENYKKMAQEINEKKNGSNEENKYKTTKRQGFGEFNNDNIPVYDNKIDYTGDFANADLSKLNDNELSEALKVQKQELSKAQGESVGDRRTRNGRMYQTFKDVKINKYSQGVEKINAEIEKRDNMSIKELNDTMLGDKYKGKGETPSLVYSNGRRIDIANNVDGGKTAVIWKDGKIERKTRLPENVTGDKTKQYFDDNLAKLDQSKYDKETDGMSDYQKFAYATSKMAVNKNYMSSEEKEHWQGVIDTYNNNSRKRASEYFEKEEANALKSKDMSYGYSDKGLKSLSNKELDDYVKKQQELISQYDKEYNQSKTYDQRYKRNKQDTIFTSAMKTKYETQLQRANDEKSRRQEEVNKYFKTQTPEEAKQEENRINKKLYGINNEPKPFVQQVDIDGGEYTYEPERIKRMEQAGMKPSTHSYTGGGWQGTKYDGTLSTKDIAKNINEYSKKEFPGVKLNRKTGVNNLDFYVMSTPQDIYKSVKDIDRMSDKDINDTLYKTTGGVSKLDDWLNKNNRKTAKGTYTNNDVKDYLKEELNTYRNRTGYAATGNEWYLNDYGKKLISGLNKEMNSYNYDDSDGMVDYFDTNFYGYVNIGKWDKPYEVSQPKSKAISMSKLVQTYVDRGYSEETARKMARQAINKRKRK